MPQAQNCCDHRVDYGELSVVREAGDNGFEESELKVERMVLGICKSSGI